MVVQSPHSLESSVPTAKNGSKTVNSQLGEGSPAKDNVSGQRRASARLQAAKQRAEKELLVKRRVEHLDEDEHENGTSSRKKVNVDSEKLELKLKHAQSAI